MQIDCTKFYVACAVANGRRYWSMPIAGNNCSSSNVKRTTVEEIGLFLANFAYYGLAQAVEVYELPTPITTLQMEQP